MDTPLCAANFIFSVEWRKPTKVGKRWVTACRAVLARKQADSCVGF